MPVRFSDGVCTQRLPGLNTTSMIAKMKQEWAMNGAVCHGLGCDRGVEGLTKFGSPIEDHDVSQVGRQRPSVDLRSMTTCGT